MDNFSIINGFTSVLYKKKVVKFSAGHNFTAVIDSEGRLFTWGLGNVKILLNIN